MNHVTYHHYGATILDASIAQLRGDMDAILNAPLDLANPTGRPPFGAQRRAGADSTAQASEAHDARMARFSLGSGLGR